MAGSDLISSPELEAIRARQAAAQEAEAAVPRVVDIKTGERFVMQVKAKRQRKRAPKVDLESLEALERAIEQVKAGTLIGVCLIGWSKERQGFDLLAHLRPGEIPETDALLYVGALELMKAELLEVADFGLDAMGEVVLMEDEDDAS